MKSNSKNQNNQNGFTLVELMISSSIFSVILLLCVSAIIQIGKTYYKGVNLTRTQNATRQAMDTISQAIQYGGSEPVRSGFGPPNIVSDLDADLFGDICIGNLLLKFKKFTPVDDASTTLGLTTFENCALPIASTEKEYLGKGMRLSRFYMAKEGASNYKIFIRVTSGDTDLMNSDQTSPNYGLCKSGPGSQYCASSQLETTVHLKLK